MLYKKPSFTVPASGVSTLCESSGQHAMPDQRGKCIRCGEKVRAVHAPSNRLREAFRLPSDDYVWVDDDGR